MQCRRRPTARFTRTAATEESTPPDSAHTTRSFPVRFFISATVFSKKPGRPQVFFRAGNVQEIFQYLSAVHGMDNFRMELKPISPSFFIRHRGVLAARRGSDHFEAFGQLCYLVAVRHPSHLRGFESAENGGFAHANFGRAVLACSSGLHLAAEFKGR